MVQTPSSPESQPRQIPQPEQLTARQPETTPGQTEEALPEGQETQAERQPEQTTTDQQVVLPQVSDDDTSDSQTDEQPAVTSGAAPTYTPAIADDVDVIEKAWVNKAKQIIRDTKDDPRAQEEQFEQLQIDYMKKRYGRDVKAQR